MKNLRLNSRASRLSFDGVAISSFEVRALPVESLWAPVSTVPIFVDEVKDSIEKAGLMNPIIVVRLPREDVLSYFAQTSKAVPGGHKQSDKFPDTPVVNIIWGGSNRLDAIKQLGYTHVDCVLIPNFQTAMQIQDQQRDAYKSSKEESDASGEAGH